jgi:transcriptional regulator with XRE-family HTH domain
MKIQEKIRFMRELKDWSQEEMAEKLGMSTNGYSKIERGETKANIPKLEQIAEVFGVDILELLTFSEKNIALSIGGDNHQNSNNVQHINSSSELTSEIKKLQLIIEHQLSIISHKDREIAHLEELLNLHKQIAISQNSRME